MNFSDIIGHENIVSGLKNTICNNTVGHAYIFAGPKGIGKKMTASIFANALVCESNKPDPCGLCPACVKSFSGNHPDIYIIEDDSNSIGVDEIRNLKKDIYIKPYEAERKIYIIKEAHRLTEQAQNSLLKVLEEPPKYGTIIMTTTNTGFFLETILSRVLIITFQPHSHDVVERFLNKKYPERKEEIPFIAAFSGGIIGRAKDVADSIEYSEMRRDITGLIMEFLSDSELEVLKSIEIFEKYKHMANSVFDFLLIWLRDAIFIKELRVKGKLINTDIIDKVKKFSDNITVKSIHKIVEYIIDTKKKIDRHTNFDLAVETMIINSWEEIHGNCSRYKV